MATRKHSRLTADGSRAARADGTGSPSAALAVAVPADRRVRVPVGLPHRRAGGARRLGRLAVRPSLRLGERVRQPARPGGGHVPVRSVRHQRADVARLRARHQRAGDDVEDAVGLGRGPRRADDGPEHAGADTVTPHTRPPADDDAEHTLVRVAECLEGRVEMELVCEPVFDYGRVPATWTIVDDAGPRRRRDRAATSRCGCRPTCRVGVEGGRVRGRHVLEAGERVYCALSWAAGFAAPADADDAERRIAATVAFWRRWLDGARIPDHRYREPIQRSALAIKGLTYMPTGATVAALTTGLPETPGGERNWDYRYSWMRDSTFTLQALHWLNLDWEADEFMQFVADLEPNDDGGMQIMYGIDGRRDLTESTLDHLSGYAGARPVRIGNGAFDQRQNDVFGAVLDAILLHSRRSQRLPRRLWPHRAGPGDVRHEGVARAGPGHLGGAGQAAALRVVEADVLGGARPGRQAGRDARRRRPQRDVAGHRRGDPRRRARARRQRATACCASTTTPTPSTPRRCWRRSSGSCPARRAGPRQRAGHRRRADRERLRPALPHRRDRRRPVRQGGHVPHLLVLAGLGAVASSASSSRPATCSSGSCASPHRSACTPRSSTSTPASTSATSRRRSRTSPSSKPPAASSSPSGSPSSSLTAARCQSPGLECMMPPSAKMVVAAR